MGAKGEKGERGDKGDPGRRGPMGPRGGSVHHRVSRRPAAQNVRRRLRADMLRNNVRPNRRPVRPREPRSSPITRPLAVAPADRHDLESWLTEEDAPQRRGRVEQDDIARPNRVRVLRSGYRRPYCTTVYSAPIPTEPESGRNSLNKVKFATSDGIPEEA